MMRLRFLSVIAITMMISSCTKNQFCTCTTVDQEEVSFSAIDGNHRNAEKDCKAMEQELGDHCLQCRIVYPS